MDSQLEIIRKNSYLGKKGYTIPKNIIDDHEINFIKNELFMKPFIPIKTFDSPTSFPVYRENSKKMYLPRFFGINRYGLPDTSEITPGIDINVEFIKHKKFKLYGIMWHPERYNSFKKFDQNIIRKIFK